MALGYVLLLVGGAVIAQGIDSGSVGLFIAIVESGSQQGCLPEGAPSPPCASLLKRTGHGRPSAAESGGAAEVVAAIVWVAA